MFCKRLYSFLANCFNALLLSPVLSSTRNILRQQRKRGVLTQMSVGVIAEELATVVIKWRSIGTQLKVELSYLDQIEEEYRRTNDRFSAMISKWIRTTDRPTWECIVKALKGNFVSEPVLANRIEERFCTDDRAIDADLQSEAGDKESCTTMTMIVLLVLLLAAVFACGLLLYLNHKSLMKSYYMMQSKTLPYISKTFIGRDEELFNISRLLDFEQSRTRVVSITGPPGFGKSTLAIKVGHHFVGEGLEVLYINMEGVLSVQRLAEKMLQAADIRRKKVTIAHVYQWARDISGQTLLIVDNCDDIIHDTKDEFQEVIQDVLQSSQLIKVVLTSRHKATLLDDSFEFLLKEFSTAASSSLLNAIIVSNTVSEDETLKLAEITGNVPLALRIVGSLLNTPDPPSASKVISELESELIETLSPEVLPSKQRIQASFNLSYKYLSPSEKHCAQILALFPGSFTSGAADAIISGVQQTCSWFEKEKKCWHVLFQRSLLQFDQRSEQYSYHILLQSFFQYKLQIEQKQHTTSVLFQESFQEYYGHMLQDLSINFKVDFVKILKLFDLEKHNIELFAQYTMSNMNDCKVQASIEAIGSALDTGLLQCRFNSTQLLLLTRTITVNFDNYVGKNCWDHNWFFIYYAKFVVHRARFQIQFRTYSAANNVLSKRWPLVESLWSKASDQTLSVHYIEFYSILSETYEMLGRKDDVLKCQAKILEKAELMDNCVPSKCDYVHLGTAYYNAGNFERSAYFYELAIKSTQNNNQKVDCLLQLHMAYEKLLQRSEANVVLNNIVSMLPQVLDDLALNVQVNLVRFLMDINEEDYAAVVMSKLLNNFNNVSMIDHHIAQDSVDLMELLCDNGNYSTAIQIGHLALKYMETRKELEFLAIKANVNNYLARAEIKNWNLLSALKHLDDSFELFEHATEYKDGCKNMFPICTVLLWLRPRCFRELYVCFVIEIILELKNTQFNIYSFAGSELVANNDKTLPLLV